MNNNIFIIDNEANTLYSLKSMLSEVGFDVGADHCLFETKKIIEKLNDRKTDLLILNIDHPCWNWVDLVHEIKGDENLKNIFIVVYTPNEDSGIEKKLINNGVNYYFSKNNLTIDEFIKKIVKIFNNIFKK